MFTALMAMCHVHRFNYPVAILLAVQILEHQVLNVIVVSSPYWNSVKVAINLFRLNLKGTQFDKLI